MIEREQWGQHPAWLAWVREVWIPGLGRVQQQKAAAAEHPACIAFARRAEQAFRSRSIPLETLKTYVSVQEPEDRDGYAEGYPHVHYPLDGTSLVHYLDPGDERTPLHIFEGDSVVEVIEPEEGLTVFMPHSLRHGVPCNRGQRDRVQLIATALPR